jgi:hypothetical protein
LKELLVLYIVHILILNKFFPWPTLVMPSPLNKAIICHL